MSLLGILGVILIIVGVVWLIQGSLIGGIVCILVGLLLAGYIGVGGGRL
jgi:hypothetical protein